jgi:hypothetical protein
MLAAAIPPILWVGRKTGSYLPGWGWDRMGIQRRKQKKTALLRGNRELPDLDSVGDGAGALGSIIFADIALASWALRPSARRDLALGQSSWVLAGTFASR